MVLLSQVYFIQHASKLLYIN